MWTICGHTINTGMKESFEIEPFEGYRIPATAVCGAFKGKTALIIAGTHSCEFPAVAAVIRTAAAVDPKKISGNILFIHCLNISGFHARSDARVPEDGGNLNACMPPSAFSTVTDRIADYIVKQIYPYVDFIADLHSGGLFEELTPCLFFPECPETKEAELAAAKAMNIPYLVSSKNQTGIIGYGAFTEKIPGLLMERGGNGLCPEEWVSSYEEDLRLLLNHLGISVYKAKQTCSHHIFEKAVYLTAECGGLWYPAVKADQTVFKGVLLGHLEDMYGNIIREYHAEEYGKVLYNTTGLSVHEGDALAAYGIL